MSSKHIATPEKYIFTHKYRVRVSDVNYGNHLDFSALVRILGDVRGVFLKRNGYHDLDVGGVGVITTNLVVNYKKEAFFDDELAICLNFKKVSKHRVNILFEVLDCKSMHEVANATIGLAFYNYLKKKPVPIPNEFIEIAKLT